MVIRDGLESLLREVQNKEEEVSKEENIIKVSSTSKTFLRDETEE